MSASHPAPDFAKSLILRNERKRRAEKRRLASRFPHRAEAVVSTFPVRFESLRDRLLKEANGTLDAVTIEHRLHDLLYGYPVWFGHTPDADAKAHSLRHDHDVTHGLAKATPLTANQVAAITRRKQERIDRDARIDARVSTLEG